MSVQIQTVIDQKAFLDSVQKGINMANKRLQSSASKLKLNIDDKGFRQPLGRITGDLKMFDSALAASNARVIAFGASTAVIGGISRAFRELAKSTIEVQKAFTDINRILNLSARQFDKFGNQLFDIGKQNAAAFNDLTKAALEFSRQGLSTNEVLKRTSDALTLVRLTGINAEKAVSSLTATVNAFDGSMLTTTEALNKFVAVETKFAVGARDLVEALGRVGSSAQDAKVGFDELNAIVTSVQQTTGRGGAVIGNAMKTIFTRLQRQDTLDALESYGVAVRNVEGQTLPAIRILQNFSKAYAGLQDSSQSYLREQVAGVFQGNILSAVLKDLTKQTSTYSQALDISTGATNEASIATAKLNKDLAAMTSQAALEFKRLQENIGKSVFEPAARMILSPLLSAMESLNDLIDGEGAGSDIANGILKGIGNVLRGPGLAAALGIIGKVFLNTTGYILKSIPALVGITTETQKRANIESFIQNVMAKEASIAQSLAGYEGDIAMQAKILSQYAEMTAQDMERQQKAVTNIAMQMAKMPNTTGAVSVAMGGKRGRAAGGFIPGVAGEVHDIKRGVGGVSRSSKPVAIPNFAFGGGVRGTMIANTGEYIVPNYSNGGSAIFNPNMIAQYGMPKGARPIRGAGGYVPNFVDTNKLAKFQGKTFAKLSSDELDELSRLTGRNIGTIKSQGVKKTLEGVSKVKANQQARRANTLDATNIAHMFVPKVGGGRLNYFYKFTEGKETRKLAKTTTGKNVDGIIFSAFGPSPNASQKVQQGGNVAKIDSVLENALVSAAAKVIKQYSPALAELPINKQKVEKQFLKEGGQGAMGAFKGALFEAIVSRLIGQKYEKGAANTTTLDIFLSGPAGKNAQDLFDIPATHRMAKHADVKSDFSSDNRGKFVKQVLKNFGPAIPLAAGAHGYIPNFAALGDAVEREAAAGVPLSSIRVNRSSKLVSPNNPAGLAVTNRRDEPNGLADVMRAGRGYVPNYAAMTPAEALKGVVGQKNSRYRMVEAALERFGKELTDGAIDLQGFETKVTAATQKMGFQTEQLQKVNNAAMKYANSLNVAAVQTQNQTTQNQAAQKMGLFGKLGALNTKIDNMAGGYVGTGIGLGLSMGLPMAAGGLQQAGMDNAAGGFQGAGIGASMGMMLGPLGALGGAAVGGAIGYFIAKSKEAARELEKMNKQLEDYNSQTKQTVGGGQSYIGAIEQLLGATSEMEFLNAQKQVTEQFERIKGTQLEDVFAKAGADVEKLTAALTNYERERVREAAVQRAQIGSKQFEFLDTVAGKSLNDLSPRQREQLEAYKRTTADALAYLPKDSKDYGKRYTDLLQRYMEQDKELKDYAPTIEAGAETLKYARQNYKDLRVFLKEDLDDTDVAALQAAAQDGVEAFGKALFTSTKTNFDNLDQATKPFIDLAQEALAVVAKNIKYILAPTQREIDVKEQQEATKRFSSIIEQINLYVSNFESRLASLDNLNKVEEQYVNQRVNLLNASGMALEAIQEQVNFQSKEYTRSVQGLQMNFFNKYSEQIAKSLKSAGLTGDKEIEKITMAQTELQTNFLTGIEAFREFAKQMEGVDAPVQFKKLLNDAERAYKQELDTLKLDYEITQSKMDLEEKRAANIDLEKSLNFEIKKALLAREKQFMKEDKRRQMNIINAQFALNDPRNMEGLTGSEQIVKRQRLEKDLANARFKVEKANLIEESKIKAVEAIAQETLINSNYDLINIQDRLINQIKALELALQKDALIKPQSVEEVKQSIDYKVGEIAIAKAQKEIDQGKDEEKNKRFIEIQQKRLISIEEKAKSANEEYNNKVKEFDDKIAEARNRAQDPTAVKAYDRSSIDFDAQKAAEELDIILKQHNDKKSVLTALQNKINSLNKEHQKDLIKNLTILKEQVRADYDKIMMARDLEKEERKKLNAQEKRLDKEAKSVSKQFQLGFQDIYTDVDYIYGRLARDLPTTFKNGMVNAMEATMDKAESFGDAMRGVAIDMLRTIRRASLDSAMSNFTLFLGAGASSKFRNSLKTKQAGGIIRAQNGMYISGNRTGDRNPALLEDGEYVLNKRAVQAMGGKPALDNLNFNMAPRFATGGAMSLNEGIGSSRLSGFFLASDNPELAEAREKAREAYEEKMRKKAERDALKQQLISTFISTAASMAVSKASEFGAKRMQQKAATNQIANATANTDNPLTATGSFFKGYSLQNADGTPVSDVQLAEFQNMKTLTPQMASNLDIKNEFETGVAAKTPKSFKKAVNTVIDDRIKVLQKTQGLDLSGSNAKESRKLYSRYFSPESVFFRNMVESRKNNKLNGGLISSGFGNIDSVPAFLAGGEYVMNSKAVRKYGLGFMGRLNGGLIPTMQAGGGVGAGQTVAPLSGQSGSTTNNISININTGGGGSSAGDAQGNANADKQSGDSSDSQAKAMSERIKAAVLQVIHEEQRVGGSLSKDKRQA